MKWGGNLAQRGRKKKKADVNTLDTINNIPSNELETMIDQVISEDTVIDTIIEEVDAPIEIVEGTTNTTITEEAVKDTVVDTIIEEVKTPVEIVKEAVIENTVVEENKVETAVEETSNVVVSEEPVKTKKGFKAKWQNMMNWFHQHKLIYRLLQIVLCICLFIGANIATMALTYFGYIQTKYYRIENGEELDVERNRTWYLTTNQNYTAITMNIGSGIHVPEYSSVHESGSMKNGGKTTGDCNYGISEESVLTNMNAIQNYVRQLDVDFLSFQEVDIASTRSYMINQYELLNEALARYSRVAARFHHTQYLLYPFKNPIGLINSDIVTYSRYKTTYGLRNQLPIKTTFFSRLEAMDNCFSLALMPVSGTDSKYLLVVNVNLDKDATVRKEQMEILNAFLLEEYEYGSYVIVAGNFNSDTAVTDGAFANEQNAPAWLTDFDESQLLECYSFVHPTNETEVANYHPLDRPYEKGVSYEAHTNGFIVSKNITAEAVILDTEYVYSNHNPVKLTFSLNTPEQEK